MSVTVTREEAAALMLGIDFIPPRSSLHGLTAAFLEEAEVALLNAKLEKASALRMQYLEQRVAVCQQRHELANAYLEALELELQKEGGSPLLSRLEDSVSERIDFDSLTYWAANVFGISLPSFVSFPAHNSSEMAAEHRDDDSLPKSLASTYTTFALLLDIFIQSAAPKYKSGDAPNHSQIAAEIERLGAKFNLGVRWDGQGKEAVRKRLHDVSGYHPAKLMKK